MYGLHKLTSEKYFELYGLNFGIPYSILRITNPFGIKQQMKHSKYSIVGWFIRQAMENNTIKIFGSGTQKRDYIYVQDMIDAFEAVAFSETTNNQCYNLGTGKSIMFKEMVESIVQTTKSGKIEYIEWPPDYENLETGNVEVSIIKLKNDTGWSAKTDFLKGLELTYRYYKENGKHYFI